MTRSKRIIKNFRMDRLRDLLNVFISTILPPVCANCKKVGSLLCADCQATLIWMSEPICPLCGQKMTRPFPQCHECQRQPLPLKQIRAAFLFEKPIPQLIHKLKYENCFALADPLAGLMADAWPRWQTAVDLVLPIPLSKERKKKRGYNQSALLARQFGKQTALPYAPHLLRRVRNTRPQVGLSSRQRLTNLSGAFEINSPEIANKNILLIDDVCTTGATLVIAAQTLLNAGAKTVSGYCLARAT